MTVYVCTDCGGTSEAPLLSSIQRKDASAEAICHDCLLTRLFGPLPVADDDSVSDDDRPPFEPDDAKCAISITGVALCLDCAALDDEPVEYRTRRPAHITHCGGCGNVLARRAVGAH